MAVIRVATTKCSHYVRDREPFKSNNVFGETRDNNVYVVYSYGRHFPMYAYIDGEWHRNTDGYSRTTAKHKSQASPGAGTYVDMDTRQLEDAIYTAERRCAVA